MKKRVKEWIENNVNPTKVMESFLWYTFSKVSDEDMIHNLKNFRELFEKSMIDDEMEWIEKRNEKPEISSNQQPRAFPARWFPAFCGQGASQD